MHFIKHIFVQGQAPPSGVLPRVFGGIEDLRGAMDAVGLEARGRIRPLTGIVQEKLVANAASNINILDNRAEVSVVADVQRLRPRSGSGQHDGDLFATRSPDPKRNPVTLQADRAWSALGLSLRKRAEYQVQ